MSTKAGVKVWEETVKIPTYKVGAPEKSPLFMETRAYQGSSGKVYPLPVTEKISDVKENVSYHALFLENEYLEVTILPELGGRIQRAYDKTNGYDFVYYNHVIKPALVGLTGPWISGGIEFNWPQHHRPTTFSPVDYSYAQNPDGSCSVFVGEIDPMYGTKGMARITLYPGKAYIEIKGQLYNPTDFPQSFLWWANPAVPVNDDTFSVFPPDVNAVMDHGKRAVSTFPIATGEYYKYDYSTGVDISRYKNIKVPTSYMAAHSNFDFIGNYDEGKKAGLLHVANHHISPGKKQWTWGCGDFGHAWDRNLTDEDGPYVELMTGVFTDNQPDFSWLKPQEEKTFVQYFMPYKGVGRVGNATKNAVIGVDTSNPNRAILKVYATGEYRNARIIVVAEGRTIYDKSTDLSPDSYFEDVFDATDTPENCVVSVLTDDGTLLARYQVYKKSLKPIPKPAEPFKRPEDMRSTEELYLAAKHLEQYHHATYDPKAYYLEGLRRDPTDIRLNNGYGLLQLRAGNLEKSIAHFKKAIEKQTWKNPNPYHGECFFNLGVALDKAGREEEAYDAFYKSTWSSETQGAGFYHLACLSARKKEYVQALSFAEQSMLHNWHNMKARTLKAMLLRILGRDSSAFLQECHEIDPLDMGILYELSLQKNDFSDWEKMMRAHALNYLKLSLEYQDAGFYQDALHILRSCPDPNPLILYYSGYILHQGGALDSARDYYLRAEQLPEDYCFPSTLDEQLILMDCIKVLKSAPMANYYLGNLLYDKKRYADAVRHWENAVKQKPQLAMAHRNLSIAYYNKEHQPEKALKAIETACSLKPDYPRFWLERDQLAAKLGQPVKARLEVLQKHEQLLSRLDALYLRYITLLNCNEHYGEALHCLSSHIFHPWEGGEGKVAAQYRFALTQLAKQKMEQKRYQEAINLLKRTLQYPENLGEGKLPSVPDNQAYYLMGISSGLLGDTESANRYLTLATKGTQTPSRVLYYNDHPSDYIYYQGLAYRELGQDGLAKKSFHKLLSFGERHLFDTVSYDFFAVSLPEIEVYQDDLQLRNTQYCNYLRALGDLGLSRNEEANQLLERILAIQPDHQGASVQWSRNLRNR
jgi:tetratricopeptide (TPR) repeat protein